MQKGNINYISCFECHNYITVESTLSVREIFLSVHLIAQHLDFSLNCITVCNALYPFTPPVLNNRILSQFVVLIISCWLFDAG